MSTENTTVNDWKLDGGEGEFIKILEPAPRVRLLKLNRPDAMNAWHGPMRQELAQAVYALAESDVRAVVISGNDKSFSAGEDVRGMDGLAEISTKRFRSIARQFHDVFDALESLEIPVIAAIEGVAAGGGMELALSCDFRVAGRRARFALPETNVGLIPGSGGCSRLVRLAGLARAKQILMLEGVMSAERADALGLVTRLVEPGAALDEALRMAVELAAKSPLALGMAKLVLNSCADVDLDTGRRLERLGQSVLKKTQDHKEGVSAFLAKRKPDWTES
ncbi:MAG: enoyl-CoA hydratase-isomerase, phenylacetic acid degradation [Polaromonas sp.]|nr:enoyl-CoA hydratase-isomerase, phenylacetic acid degradation [Polaromonas sp.]